MFTRNHFSRVALAGILGAFFSSTAASHVPGLSFDRIITIWLESQDYVKVANDPDFVELKKQGVSLTNFYALTHPSQPNYIAAIGGDYFGLDHDDGVTIPYNVSTFVDLLDWSGVSWSGYFEGIPSPGYMGGASIGAGTDKWDYVKKHNPFASYDSITHNGTRLLNLLSFDDFHRAFAADPQSIPQIVFVSPNMLNGGQNTTLQYATKWSTDFLKPLLADDAWKGQRTLIMLTYDESEDHKKPNSIATLLLGAAIPRDRKGTEDPTYYTHYSFLSTIEYNWALPCLGRYDVGANVFAAVSDLQGVYENIEPPDAKDWDNSVSYPGALNSDSEKWAPYPPPNTKVVGAGGQPILRKIKFKWNLDARDVPYDGSGTIYDGKRLPVYKPAVANVEPEDIPGAK
ncbi:phosphoesterase [Zalerion maritima]|uniref:Phosphoesterase n=1 Tax=Zalerion maritima TaxID=339359 RepID=A0AAD5WNU7_9PEZI|nr:phosphoesterase [Zalerion maritima]